MNSSFQIIPGTAEKIQLLLESSGLEFSSLQNAFFQARGENVRITLYKSGKLLIQGSDGEMFCKALCSEKLLKSPEAPADCWMGVDESGKGDLFGPLVIAGVALKKEQLSGFVSAGVRDSKELTDLKIKDLARYIRSNAPHEIVVIMPEKYNQLYEKFKNLNYLLAWGHSKVCENLREKSHASVAVFDRFAHESVLEKALFQKKGNLSIIQRTKGESDPAVAAASILARNEFVSRMEQISRKTGEKIPFGGGDLAKKAAHKIIAEKGNEFFSTVAKTHFKI